MQHRHCIQTKEKSEDHVQRLLHCVSKIEIFNPERRHKRIDKSRLQSAVEVFFSLLYLHTIQSLKALSCPEIHPNTPGTTRDKSSSINFHNCRDFLQLDVCRPEKEAL